MKPVHFISIGIALVLTTVLYFNVNTTPPPPKPVAAADAAPNVNMSMNGPMAEPASFDSIKNAALKKLSPQQSATLNDKEEAAKAATGAPQIAAYEELGQLWQRFKYPAVAANYLAEAAKLENSEKKLTFAAHLFFEEAEHEQNASVKQWLANGAIDAFNRALAINPLNDEARMELASVYINGTGQVMKGVAELRTITTRDSTQLQANMVLGTMAVESGQYDKAIARGELILRHYKDNWQACLFMAEAYKRSGQAAKAKEMLNKAKGMNPDAAFGKDVDQYMSTF